VNWEAKAKKLYADLGKGEQSAAVTLGFLGEALRHCQEERSIKTWTDLLAYAKDTLGMDNKSKVTRALRIHAQHEDDLQQVTGKSIKDACGYRCKDEPEPDKPKPKPQPVGSPLTAWEHQAAARFEKSVGGRGRAVEVMTRIAQGEKPPKGAKKKSDKAWVSAWEEVRGNRDQLLHRGELNDAWLQMSEARRRLPSYREVKADPVASLQRFRAIRTRCLHTVEEKHLKAAAGYHEQAVQIVAAGQRQVNEALDVQPAAGQSAPAAVPSAN
jgi:hypothetical protein